MNKTNAKVITNILKNDVAFFTDELNATNVYVEYPLITGHTAFVPVDNVLFKAFLSHRYRELTNTLRRPRDLFDYLAAKVDDVLYEQPSRVHIHRRVAGTLASNIYYFLANDNWEAVRVTTKEWKVSHSKKVKFLKTTADKAQVTPVGGGNLLDLLRPFINLPEDDFILFTAFLVQGFSRSSSHYAAIVSSNKGTGKSTLTKMIRSIIDPSESETPLTPTSESDLKVLLSSTYLACFDNTASMSAKFSDILCAAITGTKEAKRKLYSDCDQIILNLHNLVIINGIDIVPHRSDLADRSLLFELRPIKKENRRTDADLWSAFEAKKPQIIGAIFDTLVKAMSILPTLTFDGLERMADAYAEMTAIAVALGVSQSEFQRIFAQNKAKLQDAYNESNEFVEAVVAYMKLHGRVDKPAADLYNDMLKNCSGSLKTFPDSPSALSRKLNLEKDALAAAGYDFCRERKGDHNYLIISRIPQNQQTKAQRDYQQRRNLPAEDDASRED